MWFTIRENDSTFTDIKIRAGIVAHSLTSRSWHGNTFTDIKIREADLHASRSTTHGIKKHNTRHQKAQHTASRSMLQASTMPLKANNASGAWLSPESVTWGLLHELYQG